VIDIVTCLRTDLSDINPYQLTLVGQYCICPRDIIDKRRPGVHPMATPSCNRARYAQIALALVLTSAVPFQASAQRVGDGHPTDRATRDTGPDSDSAPRKAPDLSIITHDVVGRLGAAVPLEIKLVRAPEVDIEALTLLGLPPGASVSDATHTFSPSSDNADVDIGTWDLSKLEISQSDERNSSFPLAVAAFWMPETGGRYEVTSRRLNVRFMRGPADHPAASGGEPGSREPSAVPAREAVPSIQPALSVADRHAPSSDVIVPEVNVAPLGNAAVITSRAVSAVADETLATKAQAAVLPRPAGSPQPKPQIDPLVERARGLIRLGDISGARRLLERAQARNAPNATFLLAQTWDPAMLKSWNVRGLRADPDLARNLYAKAAGQDRADERLIAATSR